jgi:hypothetical protein
LQTLGIAGKACHEQTHQLIWYLLVVNTALGSILINFPVEIYAQIGYRIMIYDNRSINYAKKVFKECGEGPML